MLRLMVFVDGSNLFGDLRRLRLQVDDYEAFFGHVVERTLATWRACCYPANGATVQLVRINWYALADLDDWDLNDPRAQGTLREAFDRNRDLKCRYLAAVGPELTGKPEIEKSEAAWNRCFTEAREWYQERKGLIEGFRRFYFSVRSQTDFIDIIECGRWKVNLLEKEVSEKNLDTRLAVDMVTLKDGYDLALLLSGDADNVPSVHYLKSSGKQVGVVEFLAGHPPESRSAHSSSRLKVVADFVVQLYETELEAKRLARRPPDPAAGS